MSQTVSETTETPEGLITEMTLTVDDLHTINTALFAAVSEALEKAIESGMSDESMAKMETIAAAGFKVAAIGQYLEHMAEDHDEPQGLTLHYAEGHGVVIDPQVAKYVL